MHLTRRVTRNFSNFQRTLPALPASCWAVVDCANRGCCDRPLTFTVVSIGKVTPEVAEQNSAIFSESDNSWRNWLLGNPRTVKPRSA